MTDTPSKDKDKKPDLKVVAINDNITDLEEEDLQSQLVHLYAYCRQIFIEIEDYEQQEEAVAHLRAAFLAALNPLKGVDNQFTEWLEEEE
jgi:hypothetical protein